MGGNGRFSEFREAERVEIISLVDNSIDFLSTSPREEVKCFRDWVKSASRYPIAEHGFSILIRVFEGNESHSLLFDAGGSPSGVIMNARRMGINLAEVECIVLSHGHYDHFGGLPKVAKAINKSGLPIIIHDDMFRKRGTISSSGEIRKYPVIPSEDEVKPAKYIEARQPYLAADGLVLITGEIPRTTHFETGYPQHRAFIDGRWEPDPWIWDERALVIYIKRKGLVVVSGCSHAGIINTLLYARQLAGTKEVYAVLGGLHLAGKEFEGRINQTVEELRKIRPRLIVPSHCTGWRAAHAILNAMPDAFVWGSVGNLYVI
ncbi:MAG: MBL fold metallo-hydrolase [Candidatus Bathyarchaeia archaeon]